MTKMSRQKCKYFRAEKVKLKANFIIFKELSVANNCVIPKSVPVKFFAELKKIALCESTNVFDERILRCSYLLVHEKDCFSRK